MTNAAPSPVDQGPRLLVVLGPTGTGKSRLALALASRLDGEIVGCDALQVYRGLDAATAKPSAADRRRVPHHLVDVVEPRRDYSLAEYVRDAEAAIRAIAGRGRVPLVVGGTGMYLRGLLRGVVDAPPRDAALRARLSRIAERRGIVALHRWLGRVDPRSASRLTPQDRQRVLRALELALGSERTWSERLRRDGTWAAGEERYPTLKIGLDMERGLLASRLDERVERFFDAGLIEEVQRLLAAGVPREANAFKAIGYREVLDRLERGLAPRAAADAIRRNTRRYAKRQRTWFRKEPGVIWLDAAVSLDEQSARALACWAEWKG